MIRTEIKTFTKETSVAEVNGWKLNFIIESTDSGLKTIQVSGSKENNYFSANRQENGHISNSFSGGLDVPLLNEVVQEFDAIVESFEPVVIEEG